MIPLPFLHLIAAHRPLELLMDFNLSGLNLDEPYNMAHQPFC
jgi:hypothetical protein